jgi:hypothetical protein
MSPVIAIRRYDVDMAKTRASRAISRATRWCLGRNMVNAVKTDVADRKGTRVLTFPLSSGQLDAHSRVLDDLLFALFDSYARHHVMR